MYGKNYYNFKQYIIFLILYRDTCAKYTMFSKIIYFSILTAEWLILLSQHTQKYENYNICI